MKFLSGDKTSPCVADAFLGWYKQFGVAELHVSDCESYSMKPVIRKFDNLAETRHDLKIADVPCSNGAVTECDVRF